MGSRKRVSADPQICHMCKKPIASSAARTAEGRDYTYYFCGAGCEQRWMQEKHNSRHVNRSE